MIKLKFAFPYNPGFEGSYTPQDLYTYLKDRKMKDDYIVYVLRCYLVRLALIINIQYELGLCDDEVHGIALRIVKQFSDDKNVQDDLYIKALITYYERYVTSLNLESFDLRRMQRSVRRGRDYYNSVHAKGLLCTKPEGLIQSIISWYISYKEETESIKVMVNSYNRIIRENFDQNKTVYCRPIYEIFKTKFDKLSATKKYLRKFKFPLLSKMDLSETIRSLMFIHDDIIEIEQADNTKVQLSSKYHSNDAIECIKPRQLNEGESISDDNNGEKHAIKEIKPIEDNEDIDDSEDMIPGKTSIEKEENQVYDEIMQFLHTVLEENSIGKRMQNKLIVKQGFSESDNAVYRKIAFAGFIVYDYWVYKRSKIPLEKLFYGIILIKDTDNKMVEHKYDELDLSKYSSKKLGSNFLKNFRTYCKGTKEMHFENEYRVQICQYFDDKYPEYFMHYSTWDSKNKSLYEEINQLRKKY